MCGERSRRAPCRGAAFSRSILTAPASAFGTSERERWYSIESDSPMKLHIEVEKWPLLAPFRITGHTYSDRDLLTVTLEAEGCIGRGEAVGVRYRGEDAVSITNQIESVRAQCERGICRADLQHLLPAGGARNALDCALCSARNDHVDLFTRRRPRQAPRSPAAVRPAPTRSTWAASCR